MADIKRTKGEWYILINKGKADKPILAYEKKSGWLVNIDIKGEKKTFGIDKRGFCNYYCTDVSTGLNVLSAICEDNSTIKGIIDYLTSDDFVKAYSSAMEKSSNMKRVDEMNKFLSEQKS